MKRLLSKALNWVILPLGWLPIAAYLLWGWYQSGTFENAHVRLVSEPYIDSPDLKYIWSGDILKSCPIVIDRQIITSEGVVVTLQSSPPLPALSPKQLGHREFPLTVETPAGMPEGPAIYQATERPRCNWMQRISPPRIPYPPVHFTVTH
ncbi:hypothetical protein HKX54_02415 [Sulfitobacter sp. M57]|uniref:hypothetical protein n=1 Tax=unclassified Sulfitobacter TaxID=196795 RepID=UPI0023E11975|nr:MULTISPECIES: hypothetical protein [unclassified Sulfitobacter]MDF3413297.1 hypothetical protein [Sulfitobacter sp. KE5]MDF3421423.1 hypothetical protein [Sulfitobacter sp. KE43]MDF3431844.1 hypothetical protein [Sulfitobacter sp. KE42]MDF3457484.1 hypothetical protein [Sulfitobacter sp. S74]MDF3461386.1 hypothetical protein [Sulfitobacter sp. Ks18]